MWCSRQTRALIGISLSSATYGEKSSSCLGDRTIKKDRFWYLNCFHERKTEKKDSLYENQQTILSCECKLWEEKKALENFNCDYILDKDNYLGCLGKSPYSNPLLCLTQTCHLNMSMNTSSPSQGQTAAGIPDISLYLRGLLLRKIYGSLFWNSRILPYIGKW